MATCKMILEEFLMKRPLLVLVHSNSLKTGKVITIIIFSCR